jgi:hypothetical protein
MDHVLDWMLKNLTAEKITRQVYIELNWFDPDYEPNAEEESMMPKIFQYEPQIDLVN